MNSENSQGPDSIIEDNMGLVISIARSFNPKDQDELDEYIQLGRIAINKAIEKHDPARSKFSTTIWNFTKFEILRHISKSRKHKGQQEINESIHGKSKESYIWELIPDSLSVNEREVLSLYLEGYKFSEINTKFNKPLGWSNRIFYSAVDKIKNAIS